MKINIFSIWLLSLIVSICAIILIGGYTIRGVQKVIKENGTRQLLDINKKNKHFTENVKDNNYPNVQTKINQYTLSDTKRKKLMNVLDDLVQLKKKLDTDK